MLTILEKYPSVDSLKLVDDGVNKDGSFYLTVKFGITDSDGDPAHVTFVLPDGWTGTDWGIVRNQETPTHFELAHYMPGSPDQVTQVYADACKSEGRLEPVDPLNWNSNLKAAALENQRMHRT